jgi:hypothetical protein
MRQTDTDDDFPRHRRDVGRLADRIHAESATRCA